MDSHTIKYLEGRIEPACKYVFAKLGRWSGMSLEDMKQEAWIAILRFLDKGGAPEGTKDLSAYYFTVVRNHLYNHVRNRIKKQGRSNEYGEINFIESYDSEPEFEILLTRNYELSDVERQVFDFLHTRYITTEDFLKESGISRRRFDESRRELKKRFASIAKRSTETGQETIDRGSTQEVRENLQSLSPGVYKRRRKKLSASVVR